MATKYAKARDVAGQWRSEFRKVRRENRSLRAVYVEAKALLEAVGVAAHIAATKRLREALDAAVFAEPPQPGDSGRGDGGGRPNA